MWCMRNVVKRSKACGYQDIQHAHLVSALVTRNSVVKQMGHAKRYSTPVTEVSGALVLEAGSGAATLAVAKTRCELAL